VDITLQENSIDGVLSNPLVSALIEHTSDGCIVIDPHSRHIRHMNPRARELLGYSLEEAIDCLCKATLNSTACVQRCPLTAAVAGVVGGTKPSELELVYRGAAGDKVLHARARIILVRSPDGRPLAGIELFRDLTEHRALREEQRDRRSLHGIIGSSDPMQNLFRLVEQVAPYELPILITGESGVGKERVADALQFSSDRADAPYVKVNCAALNPSLIESELFGHVRGAFTGAARDRIGKFEEANGGSILLDEVGELPLGLQAKLLRVLQGGDVQRVGEDRPRHVDVRVLAATNRDIEADVAAGHFREDLYYRLAGVRVHVPPLRDRLDDIPLLANHFLDRFAADSERRGRLKPHAGISEAAARALTQRIWRGNVRELENVLRLAWIRAMPGAPIEPELLETPGLGGPRMAPAALADVEQAAIERAMTRTSGNISAAARLLGIDRTTLWRKMKKAQL
jgi:two-component system, NtrC family, response regulator HydG